MALPNQSNSSPPQPDASPKFLDPSGRQVAPEDLVICDNFDIYDFKQVKFTLLGDMLYRDRLVSSKENLQNLPQQLQDIYQRYYAPKSPGDFTTYRENQSSSSSSNNSVPLLQQHDGGNDLDSLVAEGSDSAALLAVPLNITGAVPLSQAYKQYEPRGFQLMADSRPAERVLEGMSNYSTLAATLSRKRKQIGFSREQVVMYGGLTCTPCRPSNLSNPFLTTLFRQDNFYNCPQDVYDVITPALKLAEKFITDPTHISYWSTLAFGNRVIDIKLTAATGACHERLMHSVSVTDEVYARTLNLLNRIGKLVEYRFENDAEFAGMKCFGKTIKPLRRWNLAPEYHDTPSEGHTWPAGVPFPMARVYPKDPWDDAQVVNLHPDFYTAAKRFHATKNQDVAARLRFNFWFAVNIVHELAHVFELKSSQTNFDRMASTCNSLEDFKQIMDPRLALGTHEAYWGNSTWAEAGGRWEWETFGGRVQPVNGKTDASSGVQIFNADGFASIATALKSDMPVGVCIQMAFMEEVQQQSFWARPQHTLMFPLSGARAYIFNNMHQFDIDDHLRQRDEINTAANDLLTDPAHIRLGQLLSATIAQEDTYDAEEPPSKRRRFDTTSGSVPGATKPRVIKKLNTRRRLGQPLIRHYVNKAEADAKAMHEEAMAQVAREEAERDREAALERAAAEEASIYRSPPLGQRVLHDFFAYPGEELQEHSLLEGRVEEPYTDPATKKPEDLTLDDKWKLAEEFVCLAMNWEPIEFQSQRVDHPAWRPVRLFNPDDPNGFTQEVLDMLIAERANHPGKSWPERRAAEKALYEQRRDISQRMSEMDELITYLGYSRIECHRMHHQTGKFPMGMTLLNFPAYKPMLDAFRLARKLQGSDEYVAAMNHGQVSVGATDVRLINKHNEPTPEPIVTQTAKITDYFRKARPTDLRSSSTSTAPLQSDPLGFAPLTKVPTPEEMKRKYLEWVAAGADMRSRPKGFHPSQLLSASLGGSLQTIMPSDLQKIVEQRTRKLEAEKAEQKRKEARDRADATDERSRRERRKIGSESTSSEL